MTEDEAFDTIRRGEGCQKDELDDFRSFCDCEDFIFEAVRRFGPDTLGYASDLLKEDEGFLLKAIDYDIEALRYSTDTRYKKDFVLKAVKYNGLALCGADSELCDDKDVVLAAVNNNGYALEYASEKHRDDYNIVLAAVNNNGGALKFASKWWRDDHGIVSAAIKSNGWALGYASKRLRRNAALVLKAVEFNGETFQYADITLRNDKKVVLAAVLLDEFAMDYIGKDIRKLVGKHGNIVEILSERIEMEDLNKDLRIELPKDETKKTNRNKGI